MADFVFNRSKGRVTELYDRVDTNSPASSVLVIAVLAASGVETDAVLKDKDKFADVVSGTTNEATNTGYARKTLTDSDLTAVVPDNVNDRIDLDLPDQTWTSVQATGGAWSDIVICYDADSGAGDDTNLFPMTQHDFSVTPDGNDITLQFGANGFFRAS